MNEPYSLTERLAQHLLRPVDAEMRALSRLHLLDWLGCVAGARRGAVAGVARAAEPDRLTRAALLGNVLEMDDVHRGALLHPGPVVWPAALAAIRETGGGMDALLAGAVAGYEAMIAIGETFDAHHYSLWHPTSTAGGFGGAAAAARVFGLDSERIVWALGNAGSTAGGLWQLRHEDVMTKAVHVARAALEGLWFARLARGGGTGPRLILEGQQGVHAAMTAAPKPLVLGDGWRLAEVSFKPWAACRHCHPAMDAALELRAAGRLQPPFRVETYADALTFCDRPDPVTEAQAKFSLQHAVAAIAAGREADCADFTPDAIADPVLARLRAQVEIVEAADMTARYPGHFGARVSAGGMTVELIDTRGDPERPLDRAGVVAKAMGLFAWGQVADGEAAVAAALDGDDPAAILALLDGWLA